MMILIVSDEVDSEDVEGVKECKWLDFVPKWFHVGALDSDSDWCQASYWSATTICFVTASVSIENHQSLKGKVAKQKSSNQ